MSRKSFAFRGARFEDVVSNGGLSSFNAVVARKLGEMAVDIATLRCQPIAVRVAGIAGPLFYCATDGSPTTSNEQARRKLNTALRCAAFREKLRRGGSSVR